MLKNVFLAQNMPVFDEIRIHHLEIRNRDSDSNRDSDVDFAIPFHQIVEISKTLKF